MRDTPAIRPSPFTGIRLGRRPHLTDRLSARLHAARLDRQLAAGTAPWRSPALAARALQLTSDHHRRALARGLERLVEAVEHPSRPWGSAAIPPCREQVFEARPQVAAVASRLRSPEPVHSHGIAQLHNLLADGEGPCYRPIHPLALRNALQAASQLLDVPD